jgi:hypothetical protein
MNLWRRNEMKEKYIGDITIGEWKKICLKQKHEDDPCIGCKLGDFCIELDKVIYIGDHDLTKIGTITLNTNT